MTREDIIKLARDAGVRTAKLLGEFGTENALCDLEIQDLRAAERLARAAYAAGAAAENEACAKVCERWGKNIRVETWDMAGADCAAAIRARGNK